MIPPYASEEEQGVGASVAATELSREFYRFTNDWSMRREGELLRWHLRDAAGKIVDVDQYRYDLFARHGLSVALHHEPRRRLGSVTDDTAAPSGDRP